MSSRAQTVRGSGAASRTVPRRTPRLTGRAAGLLAIVIVLTMSLVVPLRQYISQRARVAELAARVDALNRANARLEKQLDRLQDPHYLERLARECLGMVKPGEIAFVTVPKKGAPSAPGHRC
jgi:cell division protein FtsB